MNKKQRETLAAVFDHPTRANVKWTSVKSMLEAAGARVTKKQGSRRLVVIDNIRAVFHQPHPQDEMPKYAIEDVRRLLEEAGITPAA